MKQILTIVAVVFAVVSLIAITFTLNQVNQESTRLENDIQYRSSLLADGLKESVEPNFINKSDSYLQTLVERYANRQRIAGLAIVDNAGNIVAVSSSLPKELSQPQQIATNVMDSDEADGDFVTFNGKKLYVYAQPLHDNKSVVGALLIVQNAQYIDGRLLEIWTNNALRIIIQALLLSVAILLILKWIISKPIQKLVESLQSTRLNSNNHQNQTLTQNPLFNPLLKEVTHMQQSLIQARIAASEEAKASLEKLDSPWTAERLKHFVKDLIKNRQIVVVSNREPYIHKKNGNKITYYFPASGVVTATDLFMQATGGIWIANGSGDEDKAVVDNNDHIQVPPDDPKYTLRRVWLTEEEIHGYYEGFSNECLWPLTHSAHVRPTFRKEDWEQYKEVNEKFAAVVLSEIKNLKKPIILVQDFHPALVPNIIKKARPDAIIGMFWHEPWVSAETFSIFPWKKEFLDCMLGADLLGFHTQLHCNNFIGTVGHELESLIDYEQYSVTRDGYTTVIKPFPVSIAFSNGNHQATTEDEREKQEKILKDLNIHTKYIALGVERLDYIKGILERLKALEILLRNNPSLREEFTFIQIAAPTKSNVKKYREFDAEVAKEVNRINNLYQTRNWKPIVLLKKTYAHEELIRFYKLANVLLVTSLHDGMNLVAKEFVAARDDEKGVLVLSQFAGASRELKDALIVNPYNADTTAEAIFTALQMSEFDQTKRMKKMRTVVRNYNIFRWSAEFLKTLVSLG
ncbi:MAG: trehalose-6-phosphate synthase [bacterium]|nr:trehalose-6-phosphate synthase [bacterium]